MHDYITFIIVALCAVIGAGLFRIGLHLKSESRAEGAAAVAKLPNLLA